VRGRACWAAGQTGKSAHAGHRVSAKDRTIGGPQREIAHPRSGGSWSWVSADWADEDQTRVPAGDVAEFVA